MSHPSHVCSECGSLVADSIEATTSHVLFHRLDVEALERLQALVDELAEIIKGMPK